MPELLIATIGYASTALLAWSLGIFVLSQGWRREENRLFFVMSMFSGFFAVYYVFAVNIPPSPLSYGIWLLNAANMFSATSYVHFVLHALGKHERYRWYIRFCYAFSFLFIGAVALFPREFVPFVSAKLFLKSYLNAGPLYYVMYAFFSLVPLLPFIELVRESLRKTARRLRAQYYLIGSLIGFGLGPLSFYLVFDIPVSPFAGMFYGLWTIPIAYGIISDQLLEIRVIIKRTFFYSIGIGLLAGVLVVLTLLNNLLIAQVPWIQFWTVPVFTAIVAFILGRIFWRQSQEADRLKYEFITVAAHKLRTPLTRIRWEIAALREKMISPSLKESIDHIDESNNHLIELTNVVLEAAHPSSAKK